MKRYYVHVSILLWVLATSATAYAQIDAELNDDPFRIYVGGFWAESTSEIAINGEVLPPVPPISVEDLLGVEDSKGVFWGGIAWRFAKRHAVEFEHFALNRSGSASDTFSPPLEIGDTFIESGTIDTFYDTSVSRLTYGFSIMSGERWNLDFKAGLHIANLEAGIRLAGQICDPSTIPASPPGCPLDQTSTASEEVTAPLPHFGVAWAYAMTPTFALNIQAMGFAIEIDSTDGSIIEIDADIAWQPWQHFGIGAGLRYFNTTVEGSNSELNGEFQFEYLGPTIYVHATF